MSEGHHTLAGTRNAIRLIPGRAEHQNHLAGHLRDVDPQQSVDVLTQAVALDPYDAVAWFHLELAYEDNERLRETSRRLYEAAKSDHTFVPA